MTRAEIGLESVQLPDTDGIRESVPEFRLVVTGHAGYAPKGQDIVCAAVSILVQALACTLAKMSRDILYDFTVDGVAGSGCVGITAIPEPEGAERVRGAFESAVMGFCLLNQVYPRHVSVSLMGMPHTDRKENGNDEI